MSSRTATAPARAGVSQEIHPLALRPEDLARLCDRSTSLVRAAIRARVLASVKFPRPHRVILLLDADLWPWIGPWQGPRPGPRESLRSALAGRPGFKLAEVAELLSVGKTTVARLVSSGALRALQDRTWCTRWVLSDDVVAFLLRHRRPSRWES